MAFQDAKKEIDDNDDDMHEFDNEEEGSKATPNEQTHKK